MSSAASSSSVSGTVAARDLYLSAQHNIDVVLAGCVAAVTAAAAAAATPDTRVPMNQTPLVSIRVRSITDRWTIADIGDGDEFRKQYSQQGESDRALYDEAMQFQAEQQCAGVWVISETEEIATHMFFVRPTVLLPTFHDVMQSKENWKLSDLCAAFATALAATPSMSLALAARFHSNGCVEPTNVFYLRRAGDTHDIPELVIGTIDPEDETTDHALEVKLLAGEQKFFVDQVEACLAEENLNSTDAQGKGSFGWRAHIHKPGASMAAFTFFSLERVPASASERAVCVVHIHFLLVSSDVRGLGIGQKLVAFVLHFAESRHPGTRLYVKLDAKNSPNALGFWKGQMGFTLGAEPEEGAPCVPASRTFPTSHLLKALGVDTTGEEPEPDS